MAILTLSGRALLAKAIRDQADTIFLAWGSGDPAWDSAPVPEPPDATALTAELGRRRLTASAFVLPDVAGEIDTPTGTYRVVTEPSNYLLLRFVFDLSDAPTATIRETGIFLDCIPKSGLPAGQAYFLPTDLETPGAMFSLERSAAFARSPETRQTYEFVLPL